MMTDSENQKKYEYSKYAEYYMLSVFSKGLTQSSQPNVLTTDVYE